MKAFVNKLNVGLAIVIVLLGASMPAAAQAPSACYDSTSTRVHDIRDKYGVIVSRNDSVGTRWRTQLGLPTLSDAQVRIVGDTAVCRTASQSYDGALEGSYPSQPVIVLELGTLRMVVKDIGLGGGALLGIIFDQSFANVLKRLWL